MLSRRSFLRGFVAGVAGLAVPKYFDMGAAWAKHDAGLYLPGAFGYTWEMAVNSDPGILAIERDLERLWTEYTITPDQLWVNRDVYDRMVDLGLMPAPKSDKLPVLDDGTGNEVVIMKSPGDANRSSVLKLARGDSSGIVRLGGGDDLGLV
jgi:hypothetical protein